MAIVTPIKAWYCMVQVADLRVQRSSYTQEAWFRSLVESIKTDGLASPIIIDNRGGIMRPAVGMNRTRVMQELGWKECPAIVYGQLPHDTEGVPTPTLDAIAYYLRDGVPYEHHDGGILLKDYHAPEKMVHPSSEAPYYGGT